MSYSRLLWWGDNGMNDARPLNVPIRKMNFGSTDGKNEAKDPRFQDYFYNGGGYYDQLVSNPVKYLVIGRKGTGKTMLLQYFIARVNEKRESFAKIIPVNQFAEMKLNFFDYTTIKDEELRVFWKFMILKELTTLVLSNDKWRLNKGDKLKLEGIDRTASLNLTQLVEENGNDAGLKFSKNPTVDLKEHQSTTATYSVGHYYEVVSVQLDALLNLIKKNKRNYYIAFDDLDEIQIGSFGDISNPDVVTSVAKVLVDFIGAVEEVNDALYETKTKSKVLVAIRKDVKDQMQHFGHNVNKATTDGGINLNWMTPIVKSDPSNSSLGKLILHKMEVTVPQYVKMNQEYVFDSFFPRGGSIKPFDWIVTRGFGRPRDVIEFLNLYKELYPEATTVTWKNLKNVVSSYSDWFYGELLNEINILPNASSIGETITLFKTFGRSVFRYQELEKFYYLNKADFSKIQVLKNDIEALFKLGVIGNHEKGKKKGSKPIIQYSYRDGINDPDFSRNFIIHPSIKNYLSIQ